MRDYVTIAAEIEGTGAAVTPRELPTRLIHRPDLRLDPDAKEVMPAGNALTIKRG